MSVGALETLAYGSVNGKDLGTLQYLAEIIQTTIPDQDVVIILFGIISAIIDKCTAGRCIDGDVSGRN